MVQYRSLSQELDIRRNFDGKKLINKKVKSDITN